MCLHMSHCMVDARPPFVCFRHTRPSKPDRWRCISSLLPRRTYKSAVLSSRKNSSLLPHTLALPGAHVDVAAQSITSSTPALHKLTRCSPDLFIPSFPLASLSRRRPRCCTRSTRRPRRCTRARSSCACTRCTVASTCTLGLGVWRSLSLSLSLIIVVTATLSVTRSFHVDFCARSLVRGWRCGEAAAPRRNVDFDRWRCGECGACGTEPVVLWQFLSTSALHSSF